jgi:hypothetical protein
MTPVTIQLDLDKATNTNYTPLKLDRFLLYQKIINGSGRESHKATEKLTRTYGLVLSK